MIGSPDPEGAGSGVLLGKLVGGWQVGSPEDKGKVVTDYWRRYNGGLTVVMSHTETEKRTDV